MNFYSLLRGNLVQCFFADELDAEVVKTKRTSVVEEMEAVQCNGESQDLVIVRWSNLRLWSDSTHRRPLLLGVDPRLELNNGASSWLKRDTFKLREIAVKCSRNMEELFVGSGDHVEEYASRWPDDLFLGQHGNAYSSAWVLSAVKKKMSADV